MLTRVIPLRPWTAPATTAIRVPPSAHERVDGSESLAPVDRLGRPLQELCISVIGQCNFRCVYCMPRLTGGEPLLRSGIEPLISRLAALHTPEGQPVDLAMTTNGALLDRKAAGLRAAGLRRLTVSLDAISDAVFRRMNDVDFPVSHVLDGIDAAIQAGFGPVKINMVVKRGLNDGEIVPMARWFRERLGPAAVLRFIEYMDVGTSNRWRMDEVLPSQDVIELLEAHFPLQEDSVIDRLPPHDAFAVSTDRVRSALSRALPRRFAAAVTGRGFEPSGRCIPAFSPHAATTCDHGCVPKSACSAQRSRRSGAKVQTGTPNRAAARCPMTHSQGSKCTGSAADSAPRRPVTLRRKARSWRTVATRSGGAPGNLRFPFF